MIQWTEFDPATGRVTQVVFGSSPIPPTETATLGVLENVRGDPATQYVDPSTRQLTALPNPNLP